MEDVTEVDWDTLPDHLNLDQRAILRRMADVLGLMAVVELLKTDPPAQAMQIASYERMEPFCGLQLAAAKTAAQQSIAEYELKAQESLEEHRRQAQREIDARVSRALADSQANMEQAISAAVKAHVQSVPGSPRAKPDKVKLEVPKYHGKEGENLLHWFLAVETAGVAQHIRDDRTFVMFAMSHMAGKAREWSFTRLQVDRDAFPTWESFCSQIREAFHAPDSERRLRARLLTCRQGKRTLHDFVQELRYLNASMETAPLPEAVKVTIFMEGLKQGPARLQLFRCVPRTLEE